MSEKNEILIYGHGGSNNKGCEAIVRTTEKILKRNGINNEIALSTLDEEADKKAGLNPHRFISNRFLKKKSVESYFCTICNKFPGKPEIAPRIMYKNLIEDMKKNRYKLYFSVGGDNYSTANPAWLYVLNSYIDRKKGRRLLWGCSIEPETMNKRMIDDLRNYSFISARETLTYQTLLDNKVYKSNENSIKLFPDPAFLLETDNSLSNNEYLNNVIGINLSPVVKSLESSKDIVYRNYIKLIDYILSETDSKIILIPHVIIQGNNDYSVMLPLYNQYKDSNRVKIISESYNASQTKGIISRCRVFVGARTHSTIAAYSSAVPTLAVGYSVKAIGIAKDIFGSEKNMVLPVQHLKHEDELLNAFHYIHDNSEYLQKHLKEFMPNYISKTWLAGNEVKKLIEN